MKAAFVFHQERCTGCGACQIACGIENGLGADTAWRRVFTFNPAHHPAFPTRHLSLACNHCADPACLLACPAAAYRQDPNTGAVLVDSEKCIGCRYCTWVCPYDAPQFDPAASTVSKCTFCTHRLAGDEVPTCAQACPAGALLVQPREREQGEPEALGLPSSPLRPALVTPKAPPSFPSPPQRAHDAPLIPPSQPVPALKIHPRSEWGLVLFTLVIPVLVAWFAAGLLRPALKPHSGWFAGAGLAVFAMSALHLGKPLRAWRAILNVESSWLSREIVFSAGFLFFSLAFLLFPGKSPQALAILAVISGVLATVSIDGVYRKIPLGGKPSLLLFFHSAEATSTLLFVFGLLARLPEFWIPAAAFKLILTGGPHGVLVPRVTALAVACILGYRNPDWAVIATAVALAGELLDRYSFYREREPTSPSRFMALTPQVPSETVR